ncbi:UDP-N-acetylmuramoyl-tripeptide--D-alanyl-D-alanine ligase [Rhabdochlamydiaceae symbiont of Dictyostelium giganteum]|uniref:UDP-N-acetylmuramoyl-tripeptide--D-alanyl-D- alanine ligase n=1 Tax=Rhabdochlamydiaceae symbiont of Dictyostelium giganteum TaxID=3342349 RepID=UPI00384B7427
MKTLEQKSRESSLFEDGNITWDSLVTLCIERRITHFTVDSRNIQKGSLFFALKGAHHDGHGFLEIAEQKGAIAAVVDQAYSKKKETLPLIAVPDVLTALQNLAKEVQKKRSQLVIAVTGSVGKTTTKEFIAALLSKKFLVAKTPGNQNSQIGLPLVILNSLGKEEVFIAEMGMSRKGEIKNLVNILPPDIAVITKIGHSHLDTVGGNIIDVALAKSEILSHPQTKVAFIEQGAYQYPSIQEKGPSQKITFSLGDKSDVRLVPGWRVQERDAFSPLFSLPFVETHFCENMVGSIALARFMNLSWEEIFQGLEDLKLIHHRFEKIERDGVLFINDSYNASPESMKAAFENLPPPLPGGRVIAVLAEMVTLGPYSDEGHLYVGQIALDKADHLFCLGSKCSPMIEVWKEKGREAILYPSLNALKEFIFSFVRPKDIVLLKGSNCHKLWTILE